MKFIKFFANKEYLGLGEPAPVKNFIPAWYRKAESFYFAEGESSASPGLKKCSPFLDTLISGYVLKTPVNIYINEEVVEKNVFNQFNSEKNNLKIRWDGPPSLQNFIMERPKGSASTFPRPAGHYNNHLVFKEFWSMKTPRGWSALVTHPLNRNDLPFTTVSGIIDSDKFFAPGNLPFFVKRGFSGVIPEGTPFAQIIPIKRNSWKMIIDSGMADLEVQQSLLVHKENNAYKKYMWQRKKYD